MSIGRVLAGIGTLIFTFTVWAQSPDVQYDRDPVVAADPEFVEQGNCLRNEFS